MKTAEATRRRKSKPGNAADKRKAKRVYSLLAGEYPGAKPALNFSNPFELLVATILSAQCTDARVNLVTPGLFRKYPSPSFLAVASPDELERDVKSTGFYRQKAKALISTSRALVDKFGGEVPRTMQELVSLDGVGRKTANVLLGNAFGIPGIAVDTHVGRLARRLGFTSEDDPARIEDDLMDLFPKEIWTELCHLLMAHGRNVCASRLPRCEVCVINGLCPSAFKVAAKRNSKKTKGK